MNGMNWWKSERNRENKEWINEEDWRIQTYQSVRIKNKWIKYVEWFIEFMKWRR